LAQRLRDLAADGIVRRDDAEGLYELTSFGRGLEGAVHELIRWGGRWMVERGAGDEFRPEWLVVALAALIPRRRSGRIEIRTEGSVLHVSRGRVGLGEMDDPDAVIEGPAEAVLGIAAGKLPLSSVTIRGSGAAAATALGVEADASRR
ncbi:MAG TPA: winged helix-turn-helix transcriptional regulator, partial [Actinomycetota bacterium]|nr:winged helix-turn-helix transcriptional regulator [Actinomycetota bacterium]